MSVVVSPTDVVATLVCDMLGDCSFYRAAQSLDKYAHLLDSDALLAIIKSVCTSYDTYQYNRVDEVQTCRRMFVERVAALVSASADGARFIQHPTTAIAFAFHDSTRRAFIELAAKHHEATILKIIFGGADVRFICEQFGQSYRPARSGLLGHLNLLDIYWGRGLDEHVSVFLAHGARPFITSWHRASEMQLRHASLEFAEPRVPHLTTVARAIRASKCELTSRSTTVCGTFLDPDPLCPIATPLTDALTVARHIGFDVWRHRSCAHLSGSATRTEPESDVELWLAIEQARFALVWFPQLSSYVKLELVSCLVKRIPNRLMALRMFDRLDRVVKWIARRAATKNKR